MISPVTIGVDLGGTKMVAGLVSPDGAISHERFYPRPANHQAMLEEPFELVDALLTSGVAAIGLGVAGLIDRSGRLAWGAEHRRDRHCLPGVGGGDLRATRHR